MPVTINGNGSITGLVGGLPDGIVDTDTLANGLSTQGITMADQYWLNSNYSYQGFRHYLRYNSKLGKK